MVMIGITIYGINKFYCSICSFLLAQRPINKLGLISCIKHYHKVGKSSAVNLLLPFPLPFCPYLPFFSCSSFFAAGFWPNPNKLLSTYSEVFFLFLFRASASFASFSLASLIRLSSFVSTRVSFYFLIHSALMSSFFVDAFCWIWYAISTPLLL